MSSSPLPSTFVPGFHCESAIRKMRYNRLGCTDMVVSVLGHGGGAFGGCYDKMLFEDSKEMLLEGLKLGMNYVDTAPWYGQGKSEEVIGRALEGVPRKAYYVATKIGLYDLEIETRFDFTRARTRRSVERSLELLRVDYIDLIQIHGVEMCASLEQIVNHTIPALQELKDEGKIRYIGVNSYHVDVLKRIVELCPAGTIDTVLCFCRYTINNKDFASAAPFFQERGIGLINASPAGMGLLTAHPPSWHPAPSVVKRDIRRPMDYAEQRGVSLASLGYKMCLHQPHFSLCLGSPTNMKQLRENLRCACEPPTDEETTIMAELEEKFFRFVTLNNWENVEAFEYWKEMEEKGLEQPTDL